jgi:hypothetical protein
MAGSITGLWNTGSAAGTSVSGTAVCTLSHTVLTQKGQYRITVYPTIGAGAGANDAGNIQLVVGSSIINLPVAAAAGSAGPYSFTVSLDGNTDVVVKVGANTSVAAYSALITADYLGAMGQIRR